MRIVGFKAAQGLRLGVVEGEEVIDLQAVDPGLPADLGAILRQSNGDLKHLGDLAKKGVRFERFPGMEQDAKGVWKSPSGARVAWFKDPDGNILSITQI